MAQARGNPLRALAEELHTLADALDQPSRSTSRVEMLIAEGERIARAIWAVFRG